MHKYSHRQPPHSRPKMCTTGVDTRSSPEMEMAKLTVNWRRLASSIVLCTDLRAWEPCNRERLGNDGPWGASSGRHVRKRGWMKVGGHPARNRLVRPTVLDPAPSRGELRTRLLPSPSTVFQTHYRPGLGLCGQALSLGSCLQSLNLFSYYINCFHML